MSATPRLHVADDLAQGQSLRIADEQAHYLARVLRLDAGDRVRIFNGRDGEFDATIAATGKRDVQLTLGPRVRPQSGVPDLWLLFAPLKKARTDFLVEKAVELGAAELHPILTERTDTDTVRTDRLVRIAIEAAEQTERLDIPAIREPQKLDTALRGWKPSRLLYYADEAGDDGAKPWGGGEGRAPPLATVLRGPKAPAAILIGPEGGFSVAERSHLRSLPFVRPIGLGPRILRAETAAIAALSLWQALAGDWSA